MAKLLYHSASQRTSSAFIDLSMRLRHCGSLQQAYAIALESFTPYRQPGFVQAGLLAFFVEVSSDVLRCFNAVVECLRLMYDAKTLRFSLFEQFIGFCHTLMLGNSTVFASLPFHALHIFASISLQCDQGEHGDIIHGQKPVAVRYHCHDHIVWNRASEFAPQFLRFLSSHRALIFDCVVQYLSPSAEEHFERLDGTILVVYFECFGISLLRKAIQSLSQCASSQLLCRLKALLLIPVIKQSLADDIVIEMTRLEVMSNVL
ncbi:hypothetical protein C8J56DRAFT_1050606 [Mycena floridula]|nr:hypothetical protein C8J56DRAFT_1050606 [Mycena floridula]